VNICVPTTVKEWQAAEKEDGPFLLASLNEDKVPVFVSTSVSGEAESFLTLDGAILWALGMIDVREFPSHREMYDRPGAALMFFEKERARLNALANKAETED
jgi:hypothetical protein